MSFGFITHPTPTEPHNLQHLTVIHNEKRLFNISDNNSASCQTRLSAPLKFNQTKKIQSDTINEILD